MQRMPLVCEPKQAVFSKGGNGAGHTGKLTLFMSAVMEVHTLFPQRGLAWGVGLR